MSEVDELQSFITDCEWKTRKILRESNKRMKDNARSLAAKERVEKLKHGTNGKPGLTAKVLNTPLGKSKNFNRSLPQKSKLPTTPKKPITPVKEWKGRDEIISSAYETIKSFPAEKSSYYKAAAAAARKENQQGEKAQSAIHSSLSASPFHISSKGKPGSQAKSKQKSRSADDEEDDSPGGEPAMVTRRTIERDFYLMSKKRNNPPSKRRQRSKKSEPTPELKTSVLRKKYRCDERIMKSKRKRAERLYEKLKRLKMPTDEEPDDQANSQGDDSSIDSVDSSESSDEEGRVHAIHHLVERHILDENARSLRRSNKLVMKSASKPNVKEFWAHLQQSDEGAALMLSRDSQVPSVPLHIATKTFDSGAKERTCDIVHDNSLDTFSRERGPVRRYFSPYKKPSQVKLQLVVNEPLGRPSAGHPIPLSVSVFLLRNGAAGTWVYEMYDPCNGSARNFMLSGSEFDSLNRALELSLSNQPSMIDAFEKIVHHQTAQYCGDECTFVVLVSTDAPGISSRVYRSKGHISHDFDSICTEENMITNLRVCEVLQLLRTQHIYSAFDAEFWANDANGDTIWKPLLESVIGNSSASEDDFGLATLATKAHDSLLALKSEANRSSNGGIEEIFNTIQQHSKEMHGPMMEVECDAPLSMRISGCSPYSSTICPGHTSSIGKRGVWRLMEPFEEDNPDFSFPIWPSLMDTKYPESLDRSQASVFFQYKALGPQKGNCITALSSMAFESPVLAPYCFAEDKGYIAPPFSEHEIVQGMIPHVDLPCASLMENPVVSRLDTLLPPPVVVLDPGASQDDWKDAPRNADGDVYHCRELGEFDGDGFRLRTAARAIEYDYTISSMVYGISETAASPNRPTVSSFFLHTSHDTCTQPLSRKRTAADYHYIAENDGEGTLSEPYLFATHMSAYNSVFVSRKSISCYREQERFLHAAKEAERKKRELALKMKAAEELVEERLKERIAKIEHSVKRQEDLDGACESSVAVQLPVDDSSSPTDAERVPCDVDLPSPSNDQSESSKGDGDDLEQLANLLLKNDNFLKAVARKLDIPEDQIKGIGTASKETHPQEDNPREHNSAFDDKAAGSSIPHQAPPLTRTETSEPIQMPKLKLNCRRYRDIDHTSSRGDGWKRLPRSETIIGDFSLTKRNTEKGIGGPKFKRIEDGRNFIAVNAVQEFQYQTDPEQFETEPKTLFVPDLTTERLKLAKSYRQQKKTMESMLSMAQQQSLDEILQIPVSKKSEKAIEDNVVENFGEDGDADEHDETPLVKAATRPIDHATRAILAVKNHNLPDLEQVLDTEGLSAETRDQHGNSLFILACQQGSKKLAKFLLRRGANINAQNNGGNTALHYLYEYKHVSLAEYLIRKGADDSLKNGEGLTVYEGSNLG